MSAPEMTSPLDAARAFRDRGWRPIPLRWRDKRPVSGGDGWGTQAASEPTDVTLELWFGRSRVNVGIACKPSGLLVVDSDRPGALEQFAAERGETLPSTYRVRTRKDWHWYFDASEYPELGNSPGELGEYGMDVRGGGSTYGGYVVADGSVHETGHVYAAEDPTVVPAMLPGWLADAIATPVAGSSGSGTPAPIGGWTDEVRHGDAVTLGLQYQRHLGQVQHRGGDFRHQLYLAALDGWRLLDLGLLSEDQLYDDLRGVVRRVWGAEPDDRDRHIVNVEARQRATASPWRLAEQGGIKLNSATTAPGTEQDGELDPEEVRRRLWESDVDAQVRRLDIAEEARNRRTARDREPLTELDLDAFLDAPQVDYLVPGLLWRRGTSRIFGPPGETKSFLVLDLALSLATGSTWQGVRLPPTTVHYVMAEGQGVNTARALAWFHHKGLERDAARDADGRSRFVAIPQGVLLTPEGVSTYLELVRRDTPGLVILDTKARMMIGDENLAADNAVMVRAVDSIVAASGGNVCLVDHTGIADPSRPRGSNSATGAMDTEVRVTRDSDSGISTAVVTRDKAASEGATWTYRLQRVDGVSGMRPGTPAPAVCVPVGEVDDTPFHSRDDWNDQAQIELPEDVSGYKGRGSAAVRPLARFMRHRASGGTGFSLATARKAVRSKYDAKAFSDDTLERAWGALYDMGRLEFAEGVKTPTGRCLWVERPGDPGA